MKTESTVGRTWTFRSSRDYNVVYTVRDSSAGLYCDCPGFQNRESCWHVNHAWGILEYERFRAAAVKIARIKTGRNVFEEMARDRVQIYEELERKRQLYV